MFYDKFMYLCNAKKVSPSRAALDAGISKSLVTKWKTNKTIIPSPDILKKLSLYFKVSVSELLGEEEKNDSGQPKQTGVDLELNELLKQIPEDQKKLFLEMGRLFVNNLNKG